MAAEVKIHIDKEIRETIGIYLCEVEFKTQGLKPTKFSVPLVKHEIVTSRFNVDEDIAKLRETVTETALGKPKTINIHVRVKTYLGNVQQSALDQYGFQREV